MTATIRAGFGSSPITPPTPVQLAGFIEDQPATEVHDDLEVRVVHLAGEHGAVCLVICDLLGMSPRYADPIRDSVAAALGLPRAAVLTSCIHTHAGPSVIEGSRALGWLTPDGYGELLVERCTAAAVAAAASAAEAELRFGRFPLPGGLSINRRGHPYDPWFSVLDVVRPGGDRLGVLANVSIHPVALGPECLAVSTDWVGPFRSALEGAVGGTATLLSGALGDVNPHHVHCQGNECTSDGFAEAEALGVDVAAAVADRLAGAEALHDADPAVARHREIEVPVGDTYLGGSRVGASMSVELVEWSLGPVRLVSVPGEAFHALGRAVEERAGGQVLLAGLSPVWRGYLPVPFTDGYEESMSLGRQGVAAMVAALTETDPEPDTDRA